MKLAIFFRATSFKLSKIYRNSNDKGLLLITIIHRVFGNLFLK